MATVGSRYSVWLDLVADVVSRPAAVFPGTEIVGQLGETFQTRVSWNWRDPDGSIGFELTPELPGFPEPDAMDFWARNMPIIHPVALWFVATGDPRPMTIGRVPSRVAPRRSFEIVHFYLDRLGLDQQLVIPYHGDGGAAYRNFVLARGREDYSDDDLELAQRIQPLLTLIARQVRLVSRTAVMPPGASMGLTARELAVLALLRQGGTAQAIGHRLSMSPRTVHSHLASIYRKLGVNDRMRAVLVAQDLGIVRTPHEPTPESTVVTPTSWPSPKKVGWLLDSDAEAAADADQEPTPAEQKAEARDGR